MIQMVHKQKGLLIALSTLLIGVGSVWFLKQNRLPEDTLKIAQIDRKVRLSVETNKPERKTIYRKPTMKKPIVRNVREPIHRDSSERKIRRPRRPTKVIKESLEPAA